MTETNGFGIVNGYCTMQELLIELKKQNDQDAFSDDQNNPQTPNGRICCQAINRASRYIDKETQRFFYKKQLTNESIDAYGLSKNGFYLNKLSMVRVEAPTPIIKVTELLEGSQTLVEGTDYFLYDDYIEKSSQSKWTIEQKGITFSGDIGYEETPWEIKNACLAIAAAYTALGTTIVTDENGGTFSTVNKSIPKWVPPLLKEYRRKIVV